MINFIAANKPIFDFFLLSLGFAYSQQIALRAGVFSIATAGFAALGAYTVAIMVTQYGVPIPISILAGLIVGGFAGWLLSLPLARLRGAFQAIATLAFVQVVVSLLLYNESFTGGALGIRNIPRAVGTIWLLVAVAVTMYLMHAIGRTTVGRAFDALRQDETVASSLGVSIPRYHALAFVLSGILGGLFGGLQALYVFQIEPTQYGFHFMVVALTIVVLGGRATIWGPVAGAAIMALIPELARPLAENRQLINGMILIAVIIFVPNGVGDTFVHYLRNRRIMRMQQTSAAKSAATGATQEKSSVVS
jgi:branched-chain amino acid transport system permease protein